MDRYREIISRLAPRVTLQENSIRAKKSFDLSAEERAKQEAEIFNQQVGKLTDYNCTKCKNKGVVYKAVEREDFWGDMQWEVVSSKCSCMSIRNEIMRINQSGLSRLIQKNTFQNFKTKEDWQNYIKINAYNYVNKLEGWFFIGGQPGCGKTHICTAIVGKLLKDGKSAKYMLWQDDITTIKQVVNDCETYETLMNSFKKSPILYIDDFFKTRTGNTVSPADINATFKIVNYRYNENLPTIISSELSIHEISEIDEALGSRIMEMCGDRAIYIKPDKFKNYRYKFGGGAPGGD